MQAASAPDCWQGATAVALRTATTWLPALLPLPMSIVLAPSSLRTTTTFRPETCSTSTWVMALAALGAASRARVGKRATGILRLTTQTSLGGTRPAEPTGSRPPANPGNHGTLRPRDHSVSGAWEPRSMRRLILGVAVLAIAGCGGSAAVPPPSAPAPDPDRTRDLVPLTTKQATRAADRIALVVA